MNEFQDFEELAVLLGYKGTKTFFLDENNFLKGKVFKEPFLIYFTESENRILNGLFIKVNGLEYSRKFISHLRWYYLKLELI